MSKLSPAMERALGKLTNGWECADRLGERVATLDALWRRRLADRYFAGSFGMCMPQPEPIIGYRYRLFQGGIDYGTPSIDQPPKRK